VRGGLAFGCEIGRRGGNSRSFVRPAGPPQRGRDLQPTQNPRTQPEADDDKTPAPSLAGLAASFPYFSTRKKEKIQFPFISLLSVSEKNDRTHRVSLGGCVILHQMENDTEQVGLALVERLLAASLPYAHRVVNVYLFGSRAHGLATPESDHDVLAVIESACGSDDLPGSRLLEFDRHNLSITVLHLTFFRSLVHQNVVWVSTVPTPIIYY
jgi:hypothetical protein